MHKGQYHKGQYRLVTQQSLLVGLKESNGIKGLVYIR